jgi:hypothetical protein
LFVFREAKRGDSRALPALKTMLHHVVIISHCLNALNFHDATASWARRNDVCFFGEAIAVSFRGIDSSRYAPEKQTVGASQGPLLHILRFGALGNQPPR